MAREILVVTLCDLCLANDERNEKAEETPFVTIGTARPRKLALCEEHDSTYRAFVDLLNTYGQEDDSPIKTPKDSRANRNGSKAGPGRPKTPIPEGEGVACPLCSTQLLNHQSRSVHMNNQHKLGVKAWREQEVAAGRSGAFPDEPEDAPGALLAQRTLAATA